MSKYLSIMKENELSFFGKISTVVLLIFLFCSAVVNIWRQHVPHPYAFVIVIIGLILFGIAKVSNIRKGKIISFGISNMTESMANCYRIGYWLMVVGVLFTFV